MKGIDWNNAYVTVADKVSTRHRAKVILHKDWQWFLGEFPSIEAFRVFSERLGIDCELCGTEEGDEETGTVSYYKVSHKFAEGKSFWHLSELPSDVEPIIGVCNGSLVVCYFKNDGETVTIYRPNPNAEEVYKPMSLDKQIAYSQKYGNI